MPIYEYICAGCGREEEILVRSREERERDCPVCGKTMSRKVSMPGTVIFNGTGYYTTDYKRKEGGASGSNAKSGSGAPDAAKNGDAERKAEPAKDAAPAPAKDAAPASTGAPANPAPAAKKDAPAPAPEKKRA